MKSKIEQLLIYGFVGTTFCIAILFFLLPHQRFSELENRVLQATPQLTWDNLLNKNFSKETESFITDHFPFRNQWLWVKSAAEKIRLQQENNGIYNGKDGYLFEKFEEPDETAILRYVESINNFKVNHPDVTMTFMLAPTSIGLYPNRLPWLAPAYSQKKVHALVEQSLTNNLSFIDGFDILAPHAAESIYYRTDHHWTTYGAYLAYEYYVKQKGWQPLTLQQFESKPVSHSFLGSYHTKSQFTNVTPDTIEVYIPREEVTTNVYIADDDQTMNSMYVDHYLEKKDQYSYFLGGVHALMTITTNLNSQQLKQEKLLVIKDSYAHNMLPFLTNHIAEIHVIDLRYYNGNITDYMQQNGISDVLFLYNTATFVEEASLLKLQ